MAGRRHTSELGQKVELAAVFLTRYANIGVDGRQSPHTLHSSYPLQFIPFELLHPELRVSVAPYRLGIWVPSRHWVRRKGYGRGYVTDQSEGHYSDIDWVVNHLYASRHYVGLQTFEGGIRVWICDWLCGIGLTISFWSLALSAKRRFLTLLARSITPKLAIVACSRHQDLQSSTIGSRRRPTANQVALKAAHFQQAWRAGRRKMSKSSDKSTVLIVDPLPLRNLGLVSALGRLFPSRKFRVLSLVPDDAERWIQATASAV